jgi:OPA family glycerol-3-phosphate transporter-like MFS transporter
MKLFPVPGPYPVRGRSLFALLWLSYFAANLGRLSYTATMVEIIGREGFSAAAAGLVGTGFFICYGAGQIGSGYMGDRLSPRWLIFTGLLCTGLANLALGFARTGPQMLVIWCFNGLVQSVLWPSIARVITECYPNPVRERVCVNIATTYPVATLVSYGASAGVILILSWRVVFFIVSAVLFTVSVLWGLLFGKLEQAPGRQSRPAAPSISGQPRFRAFRQEDLPLAALVIICGALITQGALRDGLMTWIPAYLAQVFALRTSAAILFSGIIPLVNLAGIYAAQFIFRRVKDEIRSSLYLYGISALFALGLRCFGAFHAVLSLVFFALITAAMMGVNLMLVSFVPTHFSRLRIVGFISGLTNATVYLGSSVAVFGMGLIADKFGWDSLLMILLALTLLSALLCFLALPRWQSFTRREFL